MQWTNEQWHAITQDDQNILVSAAAGSGKTAVLVERIMRLICDADSGVDADRLLVVTFTNAAAAEMRRKMECALQKRLREDPKNQRLRRQQMLLQRAQISTVHAFCQSLLQRYFYACDVDPAFRVMDATESEFLRQSVLDTLLEERMKNSTVGFRRLADTLCKRSDEALHNVVLTLHRQFASLPFFEGRLEDFCVELSSEIPFGETRWGQYLLNAAAECIKEAFFCQEKAAAVAQNVEGMARYLPVLTADRELLGRLNDAFLLGWDALYETLESVRWDNLPVCKAAERTQAQAERKRMKDAVRRMKKLIALPQQEQKERLLAIAPPITALCSLICELETRFSAAKKEAAALDFSDLEQKTLSLLYESEGVETALANEIRMEFDAVLVDEYQDTNDVQEWIFKAVSNGKNLFTVGDVKQSIYRFRGAVPRLFLERAKRYDSGEETGMRIDLNRNFRSRKMILAGINEVFARLMTENTSEVVYDTREALQFGQTDYQPEGDVPCRLCLITAEKTRGKTAWAAEAEWVSNEILRLVASGQTILENGSYRPMRYSDIAALFRSDRLDGQELLKTLKEKGVPVVSERGPTFFEQTEVQVAISLLQIIDNPMQDIPLLAVLRSPIVGWDEDRLLRLRAACPYGDFYQVLTTAAKNGDGAVYAFLKRLSEWRERSLKEPLSRFLQELWYETDLDLFCGVQTGGTARSGRLYRLAELAADFEATNYRGLSAFVRRLLAMAEKGENPSAGMSVQSENAVNVLSIHKSKGLEYPVVFLCGIQKSLKVPDRDSCKYHKQYGISLDVLDSRLRVRYPTAVTTVIQHAKGMEELEENLRVLYVALTRAKEQLILTGVVSDAESVEKKLQQKSITREWLLDTSCYLDWILSALATVSPNAGGSNGRYGSWDLRVVADDEETETVTEETVDAPKAFHFSEPSATTAATLSYEYAYQKETRLPVKMTVTQLKRAEEENDGVLLHPRVYSFERPQFLQQIRLSGAEEGDLMHRCLQHLSFSGCSAEQELARLCQNGYLTEDEAKQLDVKMLERFLDSGLYRRIAAAKVLYRERSFETELDTDQGKMLVQGIIDCCFEEERGWILVDYKTDRTEDASVLGERYRGQLDYYARALEKLTGKPVEERLIWAARFGEIVKV